ncbi:VanZ family protein [Crossiella sp. CA198]|uniref:VanZ family protein n=1 Tax=Crossiella sp. CA198 TaxID=3455607 RepID=UPI003F8D6584
MTRLLPAVLAIVGASLLAVALFAPFVVRSYRRRGELGLGQAVLAFGFLLYALALLAYTLFPIPQIDAAWCAAHATHPQLTPLASLADVAKLQRGNGFGAVLANPAVQQLLFNVALFLPLGAFLRHYTRRSAPVVILAGFGVSLFIECTQLTGNWFLFACPYRLFDVDDLITNTSGAALGVLAAPLLRLFDRSTEIPAGDPRPVTTFRRFQGMLVDLLSVVILGGLLAGSTNVIAHFAFQVWLNDSPGGRLALTVLSTWLPAVVLLAIPALRPSGATFGQQAVRLRRTGPDGGHPGVRILPALLAGTFGYYLFSGLEQYWPGLSFLPGLLAFAAVVFAWRPRSHRGFSGLVSGLRVIDARTAVESPRDR